MSTSTQPPQRHWLVTCPRSASNMLIKILNLDEQDVLPSNLGGYFFFESTINRRKIIHKPFDQWTANDMRSLMEKTQASLDNLQKYIDESEAQGKKVFVKEHAFFVAEPMSENRMNFPDNTEPPLMIVARHHTKQTRSELNKTVLPDEYLKTWMPTFLIRHPAMLFPSMIRQLQKHSPGGVGKASAGEMTMTWQRGLYDFYARHFASESTAESDGVQWPIVLDADDVMTRPDILVKYVKLVGLNPDKLKFEWEALSEEALRAMPDSARHVLSTLNESRGIDLDKVAGDLDIGKHAAQWKDEFGEELGGDLEKWVRDAMPDFEYMKARRLRPEQA